MFVDASFDPKKHPRGQPENAGEFAKGSGAKAQRKPKAEPEKSGASKRKPKAESEKSGASESNAATRAAPDWLPNSNIDSLPDATKSRVNAIKSNLASAVPVLKYFKALKKKPRSDALRPELKSGEIVQMDASNEYNGFRPETTPHSNATGISIVINFTSKRIVFYEANNPKKVGKHYGSKMVGAILKELPGFAAVVAADTSGGFWSRMASKHPGRFQGY